MQQYHVNEVEKVNEVLTSLNEVLLFFVQRKNLVSKTSFNEVLFSQLNEVLFLPVFTIKLGEVRNSNATTGLCPCFARCVWARYSSSSSLVAYPEQKRIAGSKAPRLRKSCPSSRSLST